MLVYMPISCRDCKMDITYDEELIAERGEEADSEYYDEINDEWYCETCYELLIDERENELFNIEMT